jgi:hypothetical protein
LQLPKFLLHQFVIGTTQSTSRLCFLKTAKGTLKGIELQDNIGKPILRRFAGIRPPSHRSLETFFLDISAIVPSIENFKSEDFLFLNIWIPAGKLRKRLACSISHPWWIPLTWQSRDYPFGLLAGMKHRITVSVGYRAKII